MTLIHLKKFDLKLCFISHKVCTDTVLNISNCSSSGGYLSSQLIYLFLPTGQRIIFYVVTESVFTVKYVLINSTYRTKKKIIRHKCYIL